MYIATHKLTVECQKDFTKFGGLRMVKRWLKIAEDADNVAEMISLVRLCKSLPFDEASIREVAIGKVIKKLLKFQSPSGGDVAALHSEVESLMSLWRAKQQEANSRSVEDTEQLAQVPLTDMVVAVSERLLAQRGRPDVIKESLALQNVFNRLDSNESKAPETTVHQSSAVIMNRFPLKHSTSMDVDSANYTDITSQQSNTHFGDNTDLHHTEISPSSSNGEVVVESSPSNGSALALPAVPTLITPIKAPVAVRERKPLDMAESARKLLAMRAQQQQTLASGGADGADGSNLLSPSATNVLNILSAVGKARMASGLTDTTEQVISIIQNFILFDMMQMLISLCNYDWSC